MTTSIRRSLIINVSVQSIGAAMSFLLAIGIAHYWGVDSQGEFALIKSWVEFGSLVALLGLPQGFVYVINRLGTSARKLTQVSVMYTCATLPFAFVASFAAARTGYLPPADSSWVIIAVGMSVSAYTFHGLTRSIVLTANDGLLFSLFSIIPTVALFAAVFAQPQSLAPKLEMAYLCSAMTALALGLAWTGYVTTRRVTGTEAIDWRALFDQSWHSFLISVLGSVQIVALFGSMQLIDAGMSDVGRVSLALLVYNAVNVVCTMVSPILYNRWSRGVTAEGVALLSKRVGFVSVGMSFPLAVAAFTLIEVAEGLELGLVEGLKSPVLILCGSLPAVLYTRLLVPALFAVGRPGPITVAAIARVFIMPVLILLPVGKADVAALACLVFALTEWAGAILVGRSTLSSHSAQRGMKEELA